MARTIVVNLAAEMPKSMAGVTRKADIERRAERLVLRLIDGSRCERRDNGKGEQIRDFDIVRRDGQKEPLEVTCATLPVYEQARAAHTIDIDSTICATYGVHKQGGSRFTYTKVRGYHPLLAVAAGTGDVLHSRLRGGPAFSGRGAAGFLTETVSRVRAAGATGQLTLRADSGFYASALVDACERSDVRYSITVRMSCQLHEVIAAIPEEAWRQIPYWLEGSADVAETTYVPFASRGRRQAVRLVVRRVMPTPGSQLALAGVGYTHHGLITDREGALLDLEADHRRHAEIENTIRDLKYGMGLNHMPSGRFAANLAGDEHDRPQPDALAQPRGTGRDPAGHQDGAHALHQPSRETGAHRPAAPPPPAEPVAVARAVPRRPGAHRLIPRSDVPARVTARRARLCAAPLQHAATRTPVAAIESSRRALGHRAVRLGPACTAPIAMRHHRTWSNLFGGVGDWFGSSLPSRPSSNRA